MALRAGEEFVKKIFLGALPYSFLSLKAFLPLLFVLYLKNVFIYCANRHKPPFFAKTNKPCQSASRALAAFHGWLAVGNVVQTNPVISKSRKNAHEFNIGDVSMLRKWAS